MGPIQVVVQDGNNLVLEVTPTPSTTVILDRGIAGPPGPTGTGDVDGPASSTDNAVARFDGTTGKLIQNSVVTIGDTGNMAGVGTLAVTDLTDSSLTAGRVTYAGTGGNLVDSANLTFNGTTLTANALTVTNATTLNAGTANGVAYLNGSKVLTTGSALTFDGVNLLNDQSTASPIGLRLKNGSASTSAGTRVSFEFGGSTTGYIGNQFDGSDFNTQYMAAQHHIWLRGASEQMRLTSTGLGIGTSSPATKLEVYNATNADQYWRTSAISLYAQVNNTNGTALFGTLTNHPLTFWTNGAEKMRLDSSGNLGLGVTPSAWETGGTPQAAAFQLGGTTYGTGSLYNNFGSTYLSSNVYYNGTNWIRVAAGGGAQIQVDPINSKIAFNIAGYSGTPGSTASFTQAVTLDASGNLGVGTTSPSSMVAGNGVNGIVVGGGSGVTGMTIYSGSNSVGRLYFADGLSGDAPYVGQIQYDHSTNSMQFATNATERARITSGGDFGIGTSSPSARLHAVSAVGADSAAFSDGSNYTIAVRRIPSATGGLITGTVGSALAFGTNDNERMRLDTSGNLGIGTSSPSERLVVSSGTTNTTIQATNTSSNFQLQSNINDGYLNLNGSGNIIFRSGTPSVSERARITSSGGLLVGTTGTIFAGLLSVQSPVATNGAGFITTHNAANEYTAIACGRSGNNGNVAEWWYNTSTQVGTVSITASSTAYNTSSDYRLKNTIAPMTGALAKVALLKPCTYKWNADGSDGEGFIAHELAEVVPQCVTGQKDAVDAEGKPQYQGIDTSFLVATLTAALQELNAKFDAYVATHP